MGHFYTTVTGEGKTKKEAYFNAVDQFIREEGTRHSVRDVSKSKLLKRVAPFGVVRMEQGRNIADYTQRNTEAPQSEWLELWEFELHTHA